MQDSDDSNEHQQQSPPRPKTSKNTGAATYRTKFSSIWVSHYRGLFEVERSAHTTHTPHAHTDIPHIETVSTINQLVYS